MTVPGLVWRGRTELLERFANGSVYAEGEERRRGGKQQKRVALVCPNCGTTHAACVQCGETFDAVGRADDGRALLVNQDDPQPDDEPQRGLVGDGDHGTASADGENAPAGTVLSGESTDPWPFDIDPGLLGGGDDPPEDGYETLDMVPF